MIVNGSALLQAAPIKDMASQKHYSHGVSWGLAEAGYDIRIRQEVTFTKEDNNRIVRVWQDEENHSTGLGRFALASAMEEFQMPDNLVGVVHDKSSWARRGLSVFNTVVESGWFGFLTLELVYHGDVDLVIPAGSGIAQVLFHATTDTATYSGRYNNQEDRPVPAIHAE